MTVQWTFISIFMHYIIVFSGIFRLPSTIRRSDLGLDGIRGYFNTSLFQWLVGAARHSNPNPDRSGTIVSFKYDLGMAKLGVAVANNNSQTNAAGALTDKFKRTNTQFGVGVPMGASNFALTY